MRWGCSGRGRPTATAVISIALPPLLLLLAAAPLPQRCLADRPEAKHNHKHHHRRLQTHAERHAREKRRRNRRHHVRRRSEHLQTPITGNVGIGETPILADLVSRSNDKVLPDGTEGAASFRRNGGEQENMILGELSGTQLTEEERQHLQKEWEDMEPRLQKYLEAKKADEQDADTWYGWWRRHLMALGGGTGATVGRTGWLLFEKEAAHRMQLQDEAVLFLMLVVYLTVLTFSSLVAYRQAKNRSPVRFYADPRHFSAMSDSGDADSFLDAFNQSPKGTYLHVTGYSPTYQDAPGSQRWQGTSYLVDFAFSLDLGTWVVPDSTSGPGGPRQQAAPDLSPDGVNLSDVESLRDFLAEDELPHSNDMAIVEMQKFVSWPQWEELAINIKQQLRQLGYAGAIHVDRTDCETMSIYKNTQWANFLHSKTLKVCVALSFFGWIAFCPYMLLRCTRTLVRSYHRVDVDVADFWRLVGGHLQQYGFDPLGGPRRLPGGGFAIAREEISWSDDDEAESNGSESPRRSAAAASGLGIIGNDRDTVVADPPVAASPAT